MGISIVVLGTAFLTLAYLLAGLHALLSIDARIGARYLPASTFGTWLAIVCWPVAAALVLMRYRSGCNRRLVS